MPVPAFSLPARPPPAARPPVQPAMSLPDDDPAARLLRAVAERADRAAFAELFGLFAPRVKAYLLRLGLPAARAEELAQETMIAVWRRAASFDPAVGTVSAWVFTIARNLRIDEARRDRRALPEPDPSDDPPPAPGADEALDQLARAGRIRDALGQLSAEQAEVVRLAFFDERPHADIERTLGIPLGTVKSRLRLAMARLRALLGETS